MLAEELNKNGYVVIRGAIPKELAARQKARAYEVISLYEHEAAWIDIDSHQRERSKSGVVLPIAFGAGFYAPLGFFASAMNDILGQWEPQRLDTINITSFNGAPGSQTGISWHTDGMYYDDLTPAMTMWIALDHCGVDAPGLLIARTPDDAVKEYLGFNASAEKVPISENAPTNAYRYSSDLMDRLSLDSIKSAFPIDCPVFDPGDAAIFSAWSLHATDRDYNKIMPRVAQQLRAIGITR